MLFDDFGTVKMLSIGWEYRPTVTMGCGVISEQAIQELAEEMIACMDAQEHARTEMEMKLAHMVKLMKEYRACHRR